MNDAQREIALFRYSLIREAADNSLTTRQRGVLVREARSTPPRRPGRQTGPCRTRHHRPVDQEV